MNESSDTSHSITDSKNRCLKCVFVILEVFPKILQKIMEKTGLSAEWLHNRIHNDQYFKTQLTSEDHQVIQTLLSDGYTKLDLTLMFKIISHYSNLFINAPTRGWSSNPVPTEITIGDDVQRLRLKRNKFLHRVTTELSEKDYEEFFSEVAGISERVDRFLNCTNDESFKLRIDTFKSQTFVATEEFKKQYDEYKCLEDYFVIELREHVFKVFKAKSLKNFIKEINERSDYQDGSCSAITLTFPDLSNTEFTEVMSIFREEINQGLVNIEVKSISKGSMVMDIMVQTTVLLNDKDLKRELVTLLTVLLTISNYEEILNTLPIVAIVLSESLACFNDGQGEIVEDAATMHPKGSIQLNLRVNNDILQSEEILKSEVENLFDTIISHSNGNTVFPIDKPIVSVMEPIFRANRGDDGVLGTEWINETICQRHLKANNEANPSEKELELELKTRFDTILPKLDETIFPRENPEVAVTTSITMDYSQKSCSAAHLAQSDSGNALNTTTNEPGNQNTEAQVKVESINLQFINRSNIKTLPLRYGRVRVCTLPNGLMVFTGNLVNTLFITNTDGILQSKIKLALNAFGDAYTDMTFTNGSCVAFSSYASQVILIIDVIKEEVVKEIKTKFRPLSIALQNGYILYCANHRYMVKLDIDIGSDGSAESDLLIPKLRDEDNFKYSGKKACLRPYDSAIEKIVYSDSSTHMDATIASTNDRLCYSDIYYKVTVLDSKYNVIYKCEKLTMPFSDITIDHFGIVYISNRNNISAIFPGGETVRQVLNKDDGVQRPMCVHYDRNTQQLIVIDSEFLLRYSILKK